LSVGSDGSEQLKFQKCLVVEYQPVKITSMVYNENIDVLSIGLANGSVVSYSVKINDVSKDLDEVKSKPSLSCKCNAILNNFFSAIRKDVELFN
jgi:hypothetical protein